MSFVCWFDPLMNSIINYILHININIIKLSIIIRPPKKGENLSKMKKKNCKYDFSYFFPFELINKGFHL